MSRFLSSLWDGMAALQGGADHCVGAALRDPYPARTQAALALLGQIATLVAQLDDLYTRAEAEPESYHPDQPTEPTLDATPTLPALPPATQPALSLVVANPEPSTEPAKPTNAEEKAQRALCASLAFALDDCLPHLTRAASGLEPDAGERAHAGAVAIAARRALGLALREQGIPTKGATQP